MALEACRRYRRTAVVLGFLAVLAFFALANLNTADAADRASINSRNSDTQSARSAHQRGQAESPSSAVTRVAKKARATTASVRLDRTGHSQQSAGAKSSRTRHATHQTDSARVVKHAVATTRSAVTKAHTSVPQTRAVGRVVHKTATTTGLRQHRQSASSSSSAHTTSPTTSSAHHAKPASSKPASSSVAKDQAAKAKSKPAHTDRHTSKADHRSASAKLISGTAKKAVALTTGTLRPVTEAVTPLVIDPVVRPAVDDVVKPVVRTVIRTTTKDVVGPIIRPVVPVVAGTLPASPVPGVNLPAPIGQVGACCDTSLPPATTADDQVPASPRSAPAATKQHSNRQALIETGSAARDTALVVVGAASAASTPRAHASAFVDQHAATVHGATIRIAAPTSDSDDAAPSAIQNSTAGASGSGSGPQIAAWLSDDCTGPVERDLAFASVQGDQIQQIANRPTFSPD